MAKLVLPTLASGFLSVDALNQAFSDIETWADTVVSRDGSSPNQLEADLDLNGYNLLNIGEGGDADSLVSFGDMESYVAEKSSGLIIQKTQRFTATASQTVFVLTTFDYEPNVGNLAVYKNGVRLFAGFDYTETSATVITLLTPAALNDKISVVSNEFLATASLPPHEHPWTQITNVPVYTTRWPSYNEVTDKPTTFTPSAHTHATTDIVSGVAFPDAIRGVFVQATQPTATRVGDLWFWG